MARGIGIGGAPGPVGAISPQELLGLTDPYERQPSPLSGILGEPVLQRMQAADAQRHKRWQAGDRSPTRMTADNMWLADDVAGGMVGPIGLGGIFAGVGAKTANRGALEAAERMTKEGADPRAIWRETGWFQGPDGQWRWEIDDSGARLDLPQARAAAQQERERLAGLYEDASIIAHRAAREGITVDEARNRFFNTFKRDPAPGAPDLAVRHSPDELRAMAEDPKLLKAPEKEEFVLSQMLAHGPAYEAYSGLAERPATVERLLGFQAAYMPESDSFALARFADGKGARGSLLHEMQHGIQDREGFAQGGNPTTTIAETLPPLQARLKRLGDDLYASGKMQPVDEFSNTSAARRLTGRELMERRRQMTAGDPQFDEYWRLSDEVNDTIDRGARDYTRLAGEAEARAVQARADMTPAQRRETYPLDSYDVPLDELIVRGIGLGGGPQMSIQPMPAPSWNAKIKSYDLGVNPTRSEMMKLLRNEDTLRVLASGDDLYAWPASAALHSDVGAALGLAPKSTRHGLIGREQVTGVRR